MNITQWTDPFSGLSSMHSQLDDMFTNFFGNIPPTIAKNAAINIYTDDGKALIAEVEAPGFDKNDIEITVHNDMLEIKGKKSKKEEGKDNKRSYMVRESIESFYRSIMLPKHADSDKVSASFDQGVLKINVPLKELEASKKSKKVAIVDKKKK